MNSPKPSRAFELELKIGADSRADMLVLLEHFAEEIDHGQTKCVTGGYSEGGFFEVKEHPEMTHERYSEELAKYLEKT